MLWWVFLLGMFSLEFFCLSKFVILVLMLCGSVLNGFDREWMCILRKTHFEFDL